MKMTSLACELKYRLPVFRLMLVKESANKSRKKLVSIGSPLDAVDFLTPLFYASEEHFISLHLNAKNEVTGIHEVSHGTLSSSLVHPREVFKAALLANSHSILVCHNHPSGASLSPSADDLSTTENLIEAGKILGVSVMDHLIVGGCDEADWYSIRENHPQIWQFA